MGAICTAIVVNSTELTELTDITKAPASALVSGIGGTFRIASIIILVATALYLTVLWAERSRNSIKP